MAIVAHFLDNIFARRSERGFIVDARTYCLPGGESCYEVLYDALGYIPECIIRLQQGCGSKPLLIVDRKRGEKMKLYWVRTPESAQNIAEITSLLETKGVPIPKVYKQIGPYLLSQWIEGHPLRKELPCRYAKTMARYQAHIHGARVDFPADSSQYLQKIIHLFQKKKTVLLSGMNTAEVDSLCSMLQEEAPASLSKGIRHPDIRTYNLVRNKDGYIYSIDNENLHNGMGFEYDIFKSAYFTFRKTPWHISPYLAECACYIPHNAILKGWNFWNLLFYIDRFLFEMEEKGGKDAERYKKTLQEVISLRRRRASKEGILFHKPFYDATILHIHKRAQATEGGRSWSR